MKPWLLAIRPKTLSAAVVPVLVTTAVVYNYGYAIDWWIFISAIASTLCIQIATNLFNDAIDFDKGADSKDRLGPTRVTQAGLLDRKHVYALGFLFCFFALISGLYLVMQGGVFILWIGLISLVLTYLYTGGPLPLAYLGLGDVFVLVFFGWIATLTMFYLYTKEVSLDAFILGTQLGLLCTVLIAINNFRDYASDRLVNKNTLAARFGPRFVRTEIIMLYALTYMLQLYWLSKGFIWIFALPFLLLPLVVHIVRYVLTHEPSIQFNQYLAKSSAVYVLFAVLFSIGSLWITK